MEDKKFKATIKQHYVYRKYLSSWTPEKSTTGMIQCYRKEEKKIFSPTLMGIGQSRYFYEFHSLTEIEKMMVVLMTQSKQKIVKEANPLFLLKKISDIDELEKAHNFFKNGKVNIKNLGKYLNDYDPETYKSLKRQTGEEMQKIYESSGLIYLDKLTKGNVNFLHDKSDVIKFISYFVMQYIRTNYMRDRQAQLFSSMGKDHENLLQYIPFCQNELNLAEIPFDSKKAIEEIKKTDENLDFKKIHPYTLMSHTTQLSYALSIQHKPTLHILESVENINFITGDQPILNIYFDPSSQKEPSDVAFYYPLSPKYALIIDFKGNKYEKECSSEQVLMYNQKIINLALSQIYSIDAADFRINGIVD
ncbi:DUF4238 domain-containing protein [Pectobacterium carotovorum]|uniref:DUF4238 domain-containing protein n=1 Tax=Pectobacterium carotovorum TaxID=554 RepID=UPI00380303BC